MRARRLSKPGRILVYIMSFLMAFSSASTFCIQAVYAAVQTVDIKGDETLRGMLNVGSIVDESWDRDEELLSLLNQRDLLAVDYTRNNNILGTYTKSGELSGAPENWLSNVMYEGSVLTNNSFPGFYSVYYDNADAAVIKRGINEISVTLIPVSDTDILDNGGETEIRTWERQSDFASRFMLPHMNGPESDLKLKDGWAYHTTIYVVGIKNDPDSVKSIYSGSLLSYVEYLVYLGATPTPANMQSYMDYVEAFRKIKNERDQYTNSIAAWNLWNQFVNDSGSDSDKKHHRDHDSGSHKEDPAPSPTPTPPDPQTDMSRVVMMYMDVSDLKDAAKGDLSEILAATKDTVGGNTGLSDKTRLYILAGGRSEQLHYTDDNNDQWLLGQTNKLFEVRDGKLIPISLSDEFPISMTQDATLRQFITTVLAKDSSHYYNGDFEDYKEDTLFDLIMWSHSYGPEYGFGEDDRNSSQSSVIDDSDTLTLKEIVSALANCGVTFDFISFDSCYMSNAEVALALAPYADYLLASETEMPLDGMDYKSLIDKLIENPKIATLSKDTEGEVTGGLAKTIVDAVFEKYKDKKGEGYALTDLDKLVGDDGICEPLSTLAQMIYSAAKDPDHNKDIVNLLSYSRSAYAFEENKLGMRENGLVDIIYLSLLINEMSEDDHEDFSNACLALAGAAAGCVYSRTTHKIPDYYPSGTYPTGLSIFFPSEWRKYSGIAPVTSDFGQIDNLLKVYSDAGTYTNDRAKTAIYNSYRKAIASYGLWLMTGELMRNYWDR